MGCGAMDNRDSAFLQIGQIGGLKLIYVGKNCAFGESLVLFAPLDWRFAGSKILPLEFSGKNLPK
jgi:hypothetical protein